MIDCVYICVRVEDNYLDIVEDEVAYLSEADALASLPSPTLNELQIRWQAASDEADRRRTNRLRRERRALEKHAKREALLKPLGMSLGKAPKVNTGRESGEYQPNFHAWLESQQHTYFRVLKLEVPNQGETNA